MKQGRTKRIQTVFNVITVLIITASLIVAAIWMVDPERWNLEPLLVLLGLLYAAVPLLGQWLVKRLNTNLRREEMTLPFTLAYGYLTNYLAPVVRGLRKELDQPDTLKFYVYLPDDLDELKESNISETITELQNQKYTVDTVELNFPGEKRKKDYRTAKRTINNLVEIKYFDFPTTLLGLVPAIDFKLETKEGQSPAAQKMEIGKQYIDDFHNQLTAMLKFKKYDAIKDNIEIVSGGGVNFLDLE